MDKAQPAPGAVTVTVVQARACHLCEDAQEALAEIGRDFPLHVELVADDSERGTALLRAHRAGLFPLVLVDGAYFSVGRLPRRKLRKQLQGRAEAGMRKGSVA